MKKAVDLVINRSMENGLINGQQKSCPALIRI
jgi:hypothetical protein